MYDAAAYAYDNAGNTLGMGWWPTFARRTTSDFATPGRANVGRWTTFMLDLRRGEIAGIAPHLPARNPVGASGYPRGQMWATCQEAEEEQACGVGERERRAEVRPRARDPGNHHHREQQVVDDAAALPEGDRFTEICTEARVPAGVDGSHGSPSDSRDYLSLLPKGEFVWSRPGANQNIYSHRGAVRQPSDAVRCSRVAVR